MKADCVAVSHTHICKFLLSFLLENVTINGCNSVVGMTSENCDGMSVPCGHEEAAV